MIAAGADFPKPGIMKRDEHDARAYKLSTNPGRGRQRA